jgi:hypothetical protein
VQRAEPQMVEMLESEGVKDVVMARKDLPV